MVSVVSKQEIERLKRIEGKVRGIAFKLEFEFIKSEEGGEGVERLEEEMEKLGFPIRYKEIEKMKFYPLKVWGVFLLSMKRLFDFDDEKFERMGEFESKVSLIMKIFMKHFVSVERVAKVVPKMWRMYFDVGDLRITEFDEDQGYIYGKLANYALHPVHCQYLRGYFANIIKMVVNKPVTCQETKCVHRGDGYHEFFLEW